MHRDRKYISSAQAQELGRGGKGKVRDTEWLRNHYGVSFRGDESVLDLDMVMVAQL